jgi:hypothetical protein
LLTEAEYKYGGYEPTVSPYTPQAASDLTEAVVTYIQGEMKTHSSDHKNQKQQ